MNNNNNSGRAFLIIVLILIFCVVLYFFVASRNSTKTDNTLALNSATGFSPLNTYSDNPDANGNVSNPYPYDFSTPVEPAPTPVIPTYYRPIAVAPKQNTPVATPATPQEIAQQEYVQQQAAQSTLKTLQATYYDTSYVPPEDVVAASDTPAVTGSPSSFNWMNAWAGGSAGSVVGMFLGDPMGGAILGGLLGGGGLDKLTGGGGGAIGGVGGIGGIGGGGALIDFGGTVKKNIRCTCSTSNLMTIQGANGKQVELLFTPGVSKVETGGNTNGVGQQAIGQYTAGGQCLMTGDPCQSQGQPKGTIKTIGTS